MVYKTRFANCLSMTDGFAQRTTPFVLTFFSKLPV